MRSDLTDLTFIIDRSGSMRSCKTDAEGGVNSFIKNQKEQAGECTFSLVQFDTEYDFVHKAKPIRDVSLEYVLHPRGGTALLDAIGRAITETGNRLKDIGDSQRPGLVVFVIVTDGQENSSREFTRTKIKEMIEHQQSVYNWQFTFLGANQDAFAEAASIGILRDSTLDYAEEKTSRTISLASAGVTRMRIASFTGKAIENVYTDAERESVVN